MTEIEFEITLDTLLDIADATLRNWLLKWQNDDGNPLEFDGDIMTCSIEAIDCINLSIRLKEREQ